MRPFSLTFCFLRLQDSHAWAVRCLLSGSTLGRVMATIQSCHTDSAVILLKAWLVLAVALDLDVESLLLLGESLGAWTPSGHCGSLGCCGYCILYCIRRSEAAFEMSSIG